MVTAAVIALTELIATFEEIEEKETDKSDEIMEFCEGCVLLRNAMSIQEQYELYKAVIKASYYTKQSKNKNKKFQDKLMKIIPTNKNHKCRLSPIYDTLFDRTLHILSSNASKLKTKLPSKERLIKSHMKALNYSSPNGFVFRHYDNIKRQWVVLYSIGCTVMFYANKLKLPSTNGVQFDFNSGDILVFNSTTIEHGVDAVVADSCPTELANIDEKCSKLQHVRISVQTRCNIAKKKSD